ncbi:MAG: DUF5317 family protein [Chloroflexota bacterium]
MFLIYPIIAAVVIGLLLGGRPSNLGRVQLRWSAAIAAGMAIQVALFVEPVTARIGDLGPPIYIASSLLVLAAVIRNWRLPGLAILAVGAASNLAAILANGGYMPASPEALAALTRGDSDVYSNSAMMGSPMLAPLTDIFAMPAWVPFANIFSIGDVLIGIGVATTIVLGMLGRVDPWNDMTPASPDPASPAAVGGAWTH